MRANGVVCPRGKGQISLAAVVLTQAMLLCANALSAHHHQPLLEMGLWPDWRAAAAAIGKEFAPRRSNDPELLLPFIFELRLSKTVIMVKLWLIDALMSD